MMDDKEGLLIFVLSFFLGVVAMIVIVMPKYIPRQTAVDKGHAYYDGKTKEFKWNDK